MRKGQRLLRLAFGGRVGIEVGEPLLRTRPVGMRQYPNSAGNHDGIRGYGRNGWIGIVECWRQNLPADRAGKPRLVLCSAYLQDEPPSMDVTCVAIGDGRGKVCHSRPIRQNGPCATVAHIDAV